MRRGPASGTCFALDANAGAGDCAKVFAIASGLSPSSGFGDGIGLLGEVGAYRGLDAMVPAMTNS